MSDRCRCGWTLPNAVTPLDLETEEITPTAFIHITCPHCGKGHAFFDSNNPDQVRVYERKRRHANNDAN